MKKLLILMFACACNFSVHAMETELNELPKKQTKTSLNRELIDKYNAITKDEKNPRIKVPLETRMKEKRSLMRQIFTISIDDSKYDYLKNSLLPLAIGYKKSVQTDWLGRVIYVHYCLFNKEDKINFIARAKAIKLKKKVAYSEASNKESDEGQTLLKKYQRAVKVVLLMQEFKKLSFKDQLKFDSYLTNCETQILEDEYY